MPERLAEAKIYYEDYIKYFSGTELSEQAKIYATDIEERTNTLTEL